MITEKARTLKDYIKSFEVAIISRIDPAKQLNYTTIDIKRELIKQLITNGGMKVNMTLKILMKKQKIDENGEVYFIFQEPDFNCSIFTINNSDEIMGALDRAAEEINGTISIWLSEGSGWVVEEIQHHYFNIVKYVPLRGSSYLPLPVELRNSKGLINPKNNDQKCAIWCIVKHFNLQKKNPQRITLSDQEFIKKLDLSGITFPVTIKQIPKLEKQNKININVFRYDNIKRKLYPYHLSKEKNEEVVNMLYIEEGDKNHYVYIKDFNKLMYNFTKHKERKHFCMHCLHCFRSNDTLEKHKKDCIAINGVQVTDLPQPYIDKNGKKRIPSVYFKNHHKQLPRPFTIYTDFESITEKITSCTPSDQQSYTETYQRHTACSFSYKVVCHYDKKYSKDTVLFRGAGAVYKFLVSLLLEVEEIKNVI